jgi:predicted AAA+ superfamily ATPase
MYRRNILQSVTAALADTRVVLLNGARQSGKSTIAERIARERGGRYLTLDDAATLAAARTDPAAFVDGGERMLVIDEIQKAPELFPAIKLRVDRNRAPGRYLLTGSANVVLLPRLSDSLAGRMEIFTLHPLAQDELADRRSDFAARLFADARWSRGGGASDRTEICRRIVAGGFPEAVARDSADRRDAWFRSYVMSILQRDVRDLANIDGLLEMPRLLALLAARTSALMNMAEISRSIAIAHSTLKRYLTLLEATFLLNPLPAWSSNRGKRLVKSAKIHLVDAGLAAHLGGLSDPTALAAAPALGPLLETFVVQELRKQAGWTSAPATLHHFRTALGREVDIVLERANGEIAGIEVKATTRLSPADFAGLEELATTAGRKFRRGVLLYLGDQMLPFGERLLAIPMAELWAAA